MKKFLIAAALLLLPLAAHAQQTEGAVLPGNTANRSGLAGCIYRATPLTPADGQQMAVTCDSSGNLVTANSGAMAPIATAAVSGSLIAKATPGNLLAWAVTSGASAGYVLIFDSATVPADGAVTPKDCRALAANSSLGSSLNTPEKYSTGITLVFSTTGCFAKTISATAYIKATVQ